MNKNYDLYIFDFDGTLADSGTGIAHTAQHFSQLKGLPQYSEREILNAVGHGVEDLLDALYSIHQMPPRDKINFINEFITIYRQKQREQTFLYPEVENILEILQRKNKKMAIISNKPDDLLVDVVNQLNLNRFPWIKVAGAQSFALPKPDGLPLQKVMELAEVDANQTVMIGDSCADFLAAQNAHTDFIGCLFGIGSKELQETYPQVTLINEFSALKNYI